MPTNTTANESNVDPNHNNTIDKNHNIQDTISGHKRNLTESHHTDINTGKSPEDKHDNNEELFEASKKPSVQVRCSHLLIKHKDSRRPQSWKNENINITKEEAFAKAKQLRDQILEEVSLNGNENNITKVFKTVATKESDCNSYKRGGDLGLFGLGKMQKPFEEVAFNLQIGELSQPVETASGVHLILRTQ